MAELIDISRIQVKPNRQRRNFDMAALMELGTSLGDTAFGMMHPIVLERGEGETLFLVAGERRLRATKLRAELNQTIKFQGAAVPVGFIPATDIGALDPIDAFEAELEENIRREDLTIVEKAQATAKLMELRGAQAARDGRPPPTAADLAREIYDVPKEKPAGQLGSLQTTIRDQLIVARHATDSDVQKATSLKEAVNIIKKKETAAQNTALAASIGATFTANDLQLENIDSLKWAQSAAGSQFDLIITDPPYGMGADEFGDSGTDAPAVGAHSYADSYEHWCKVMDVFCPESFRLAAIDAHAYIFCDFDRFHDLKDRMTAAGWKVFRTPLIWHNLDGFRTPWVEKGPQRKYECILFALKGEKRVNAVKPDVLAYKKDSATGHPAQKPVGLITDLISRSYRPDSHLWDGFAGSGAVAEACYEYKIKFTGQELDPTHYGTALKRIRALSAYDPGLY